MSHAPSILWRWTAWSGLSAQEVHDLARLRQDVFIVEQTCAYADLDGRDPEAWHLLGFDGDALVAVLRVFAPGPDEPVHRIGRVVVRASHRRSGLGAKLMQQAHRQIADQHGPVAIVLGAQAHLRGFYEALGYVVDGPGYDEDGIPHLPMRRR